MPRAGELLSRKQVMLRVTEPSLRAAINPKMRISATAPTLKTERCSLATLYRICAAVVISVASVVGSAGEASALPLTLFRYDTQAQRHCPSDAVVWLDFRKNKYYTKQQRRYGSGFTGSFVCREQARSSGYRRSLLGLR